MVGTEGPLTDTDAPGGRCETRGATTVTPCHGALGRCCDARGITTSTPCYGVYIRSNNTVTIIKYKTNKNIKSKHKMLNKL